MEANRSNLIPVLLLAFAAVAAVALIICSAMRQYDGRCQCETADACKLPKHGPPFRVYDKIVTGSGLNGEMPPYAVFCERCGDWETGRPEYVPVASGGHFWQQCPECGHRILHVELRR